jgi:hypothetical protein
MTTAIERFVEAGGRTGVTVYRAVRAEGLAAAGRIDDASAALAAARRELETYGERYGEPLVVEAEACVCHARGDDPAMVGALLSRAATLAHDQGAHGVASRITATAARLGVEL